MTVPVESKPAPVALFAYNRPQHLSRTLEALAANDLAPETDVTVYSDGARDTTSEPLVAEVRRILESSWGFKSLNVVARPENYGLARSIVDGVNETVNRYGRVIVMEDDLLASPWFLRFMNDGLNEYRNDDSIISIHGYAYPLLRPVPELYFMRGADCYGWATWKRGWNEFNPDASALRDELERRGLIAEFTFNGSFPFERILDEDIRGVRKSWAIRWYASAFLNERLTLYPGQSLIQHIGMDGSGANLGSTDALEARMSSGPVPMRRIALEESPEARTAWEEYFHSIKPGMVRRVYGSVKRGLLQRLNG